MNPPIPSFVWQSPPIQGLSPPARYGHSAVLYHNSMIVFGGYQAETDTTLNDLHVLDLETWTWMQPQEVSGAFPSPRSFHTAVLAQDHMLVWGGTEQYQEGGFLFTDTDLYLLDLKTWSWSRVTPEGVPPEARSHHSSILFENHLLIDGGSFDMYAAWADLHLLDLTRLCWREIAVENGPNSALAGLKLRGNTLVKFCGDGAYNGFCQNILTLDLSGINAEGPLKLQWQIAPSQDLEQPTGETTSSEDFDPDEDFDSEDEFEMDDDEEFFPYRTIHGYGEFGDNLVLFAGMAPDDGVSHNTIGDVVLLNLPPIAATTSGTYTWRVPVVAGNFPPPRFGHTSLQLGSQMLIYGGKWFDMIEGNHQYDNEVYLLELLSHDLSS